VNKPAKKQRGRPALPPERRRSARLSMRTYQDVAAKAARVGTAAVEAAIRRIKEPSRVIEVDIEKAWIKA